MTEEEERALGERILRRMAVYDRGLADTLMIRHDIAFIDCDIDLGTLAQSAVEIIGEPQRINAELLDALREIVQTGDALTAFQIAAYPHQMGTAEHKSRRRDKAKAVADARRLLARLGVVI